MLNRFFVSLSLALLAGIASTGAAFADTGYSDKTNVMVGTGLVIIAMMVLVTIAWAIKHSLGLDKMPPDTRPEPAEPHH